MYRPPPLPPEESGGGVCTQAISKTIGWGELSQKLNFMGGNFSKARMNLGVGFKIFKLSQIAVPPVTGNKRPPLNCPPHIEIVEINSPLSDGDPYEYGRDKIIRFFALESH